MPRGNLRRTFDRGFVRPHSRTNRLKMEANPYRPFKLGSRFRIRRELLRSNPWWWVTHRRGIFRPKVGQDPLEARAVPKELVKGTLPERIVYRYCVEKLGMIQGVDMDFQSCLTKDHRVLTADLRWVPVQDLCPGDQLLNFSEHHGTDNDRHMRTWESGVVLSNNPGQSEVYDVELSDGTVITATPEHPWLVNYNEAKHYTGEHTPFTWMRTDKLRPGIVIPRFLKPWDANESYAAGWLAGFFDGEGSVIHGKCPAGGYNLTLTCSQNAGPMFDRMIKLTELCGFEFSTYDYRGKHNRSYDDGKRQVIHMRIKGGRPEALRFLGTIRPSKMDRIVPAKLGRLTKIDNVKVVAVRPAGVQTIYRLGVSNHTYFAEGFGMHNSLEGGRLEMGGIVVDFTFRFLHIAIQVQGPTHNALARFRKDEEQRLILEQMGYSVIYLDMALIYDQPLFEDTMRQIFLRQGYARGGVHGNHEVDEGVNGQADELERLAGLLDHIEFLFQKALTGIANEWQV
jgi:hypothetical protein